VQSIFFYNYTLNQAAVKEFQAFIEYKKGSLVGLHLFHENGMDKTFRKGVTFFLMIFRKKSYSKNKNPILRPFAGG
jgi:hypothetical protein